MDSSELMKALDIEFTRDEYRVIFHNADTNRSGVIDIDEFLSSFPCEEE